MSRVGGSLSRCSPAIFDFIGGFVAYRVVTGSWTVLPNTLSNAASLAWWGPIMAVGVLWLIGPHGLLGGLWQPGMTIVLAPDSTSYKAGDVGGRVEWARIAFITSEPAGRGAVMRGATGEILASLPGLVRRRGSGTRWLIELIVQSLPGRYASSGKLYREARAIGSR